MHKMVYQLNLKAGDMILLFGFIDANGITIKRKHPVAAFIIKHSFLGGYVAICEDRITTLSSFDFAERVASLEDAV